MEYVGKKRLMYGTGKEQVDQIRFSHLKSILNECKSLLKDHYTITIHRQSRDYYHIRWQSTDHYGGLIEIIFEEDQVIETKVSSRWRS